MHDTRPASAPQIKVLRGEDGGPGEGEENVYKSSPPLPQAAGGDLLLPGCKVNLNLYITGVRADGWHELNSLFVPLTEPCDRLWLELTDEPGLKVECDTAGIDLEQNTLTKAYRLFEAAGGWTPGLRARLEKGIPHGAGLGGGSSDAAALLRWLNDRAPNALDEERLRDVAVRVGADVPFFLCNTPCRATGVGERLEPCGLGALAGWYAVLVCPPEKVSTPWAYRAFDEAAGDLRDTTLTALGSRAIKRASLAAEWPEVALINDFEPVVFAAYPAVRACKERLLQVGAAGAVMSGSGAAVVGLFRHREAGEAAVRAFTVPEQGYGAYLHALD